jgi:hypothetical protein
LLSIDQPDLIDAVYQGTQTTVNTQDGAAWI